LLYTLQVNNQPPVLGEMAIGCGVINNATKAGQKPLEAVAALYSYFSSNGSSNWCYNFTYDPKFPLLPDSPTGFNSYTYQVGHVPYFRLVLFCGCVTGLHVLSHRSHVCFVGYPF
jgi:hypothetical protein